MGALTTLFHLAMVVHYGYGIKVYLLDLRPPEEILKLRNIGYGPFKYLTFWDMLLQFTYFSFAFVNDMVGTNTPVHHKQSVTQRVRDYMFSTVAFSAGLFVTVSFWGLYNIDRKLIFPEIFDSFFPLWLNHNVHTTPGVGALLELCLIQHSFPSRTSGFATVAFFTLIYLSWVCFIAYQTGHWVYPVLANLIMPARVAFIGFMMVLMGVFYFIGKVSTKESGVRKRRRRHRSKSRSKSRNRR